MKNIKFRAWDSDSSQMFYSDDGKGFQFELSPIGGNGIRDLKGNDLDGRFSEWMQFTGLVDANGRKIYENDLLRRPASGEEPRGIFRVSFVFGCWHMSSEDTHFLLYPKRKENKNGGEIDLVVVGNVHENPEFLKKNVKQPL